MYNHWWSTWRLMHVKVACCWQDLLSTDEGGDFGLCFWTSVSKDVVCMFWAASWYSRCIVVVVVVVYDVTQMLGHFLFSKPQFSAKECWWMSVVVVQQRNLSSDPVFLNRTQRHASIHILTRMTSPPSQSTWFVWAHRRYVPCIYCKVTCWPPMNPYHSPTHHS